MDYTWINKIFDKLLKSLKFLFFSFIPSYSFKTISRLFTETNSSWLTHEWINVLKIKTSVLFNLIFANNTILSCLFFCFNYWLVLSKYLLIAQGFNPTAELVIPIEISTKEAKADIVTHPVTLEARKSKCSI